LNQEFNYINFNEKIIHSLIISAKEGDKLSVERLHSIIRDVAHSYFLSKYKLKKIYNHDDIDDLTNDVCISFYENLNRIDNIENWLRKVLYFKFVSFYKKSRSRQTFELNTAIHKSVDPDVSIPLDSEIVLTQLNRLSEDKRLIIRQRFWEGLKFQEIAENMNKSEAAVKKMFYRTLDELKNKF